MIGFSAIYISAAMLFYQQALGDAALVYANIVNLTARILYAATFVKGYFPSGVLDWRSQLIPQPALLVLCAASWFATRYSGQRLDINKAPLVSTQMAIHVGLGGALGATSLAVWWFSDGRYKMSRRVKQE
jgi:oligosaccharide translocation protein RFT1